MIFGTLAAAHISKSDGATAGTLIIRLHMYHFIPRQHTDKATCPSALDLGKHFAEDKQCCFSHPSSRLLSQPRPTFHYSPWRSNSFYAQVLFFVFLFCPAQLQRGKIKPKI